jgi:hypothetical protein
MATPSKAKKVLFTALAGLGVTAGAAGLASAATSQTTPTTPPAAEQRQAGTGDSPDYTSSVTVPQSPDSETDDEATDAAKLAAVATVTPEQAIAAATAAVPGTAGTPELSDENGNVVYDVEVTAADGSKVGVKVDAGNGSVLAQETDEAGDEKGADKGEGPEGTQSESETPDAPTSN